MLLEMTSDQEFFRDTTAKFLEDLVPAEELRHLRDDDAGFDADYWRRGAELGWTSLLVSEDDGGGSISGDGLIDLGLVAYEFGRHAAPGPLLSVNMAAGALSATGDHRDLLAEILTGTSLVTWALEEPPPHDGLGPWGLEIVADGGDYLVNGVKRPVESVAEAGHLLVTGRTGEGLSQVLVPHDADGVSIRPMRGVDLTRRFSVVSFDDVRLPAEALIGDAGGAADAVERQLHHALTLLNAEAVGAMQAGFDMTVEWAFDRYSFGRPLASYQALKHRFASMKTSLEGSHAISDAATGAVAADRGDAAELCSAATAYIGDHGTELLQECVQLHGGIGVTFEHDLHLYLRRMSLSRALFGTPTQHRRRIAGLIAEREETP